MKNLNKIFLIVVIAFVANNVNAQEKFSFGVSAGVTMSDIFQSSTDNNPMQDALGLTFGYTFGVTVDYNLTDNFFIQSGLSFITKGTEGEYIYMISSDSFSSSDKIKAQSMYLQLPIYAGYKFQVAENVKLLFNVGPYFAYGIGGKVKSEHVAKMGGIVIDAYGIKEDVFSNDGFKRFDCGLGFGAGVEFGKIGVSAAYYLGLININAHDTDNSTAKNGSFALTVSYKF